MLGSIENWISEIDSKRSYVVRVGLALLAKVWNSRLTFNMPILLLDAIQNHVLYKFCLLLPIAPRALVVVYSPCEMKGLFRQQYSILVRRRGVWSYFSSNYRCLK